MGSGDSRHLARVVVIIEGETGIRKEITEVLNIKRQQYGIAN